MKPLSPVLRGFLPLALMAAPLQAQATPTINKLSDIDLGSILAGATAGTVILNSPSGTRSSSGGTALGTSLNEVLGSLTLSGKGGDSWAIGPSGALPFTLSRIGGGTLKVTAVDFEPSTTNTGVFPHSKPTSIYYLGVSIAVGTSAVTPLGTYTGAFSLLLRDTSSGGKQSTASFTVKVRVDAIITLAQTASLQFGDIFPSSSPGQVILSPAGLRTAVGGLLLGGLSPSGAAAFLVNGAPNATYSILLPTRVTLTGPAGTLLVSDFTSAPSSSGVLSTTGSQTLNVGGTLTVAASQPDGDYSGTFGMTVAYN